MRRKNLRRAAPVARLATGWISIGTCHSVPRVAARTDPALVVPGCDDYEWHLGVAFRMGLFAVDNRVAQKTRTARKAVEGYRRISGTKKLPGDLRKKYPEKR